MSDKAVVYTRFSPRPTPEESKSLEVQETTCRAYCTLRGMEVVSVIRDAEQSAHKKNLSDRPGGKQVLALIEQGIRHIVVQKIDRIFRSINGRVVMDEWNACGVSLHLADQSGCSINCSTATGKFIVTMLIGVGELEAGLTGERTSSSMKMRQSSGQIMGKIPYGYKACGEGRFESCPEEQNVLNIITQFHAQGVACHEIAAWLDEHDFPARKGKKWHGFTISTILKRVLDKSRDLSIVS